MEFHRSVLLNESIQALAIRADGTYVDATYGGGGHARAILAQLEQGRLFGFDQDEAALANRPDDDRLTLIHSNFRYLQNFLRLYRAIPVDGILADLGVSSHQIDQPDRGFSTRFEGTLDMRMDRRKGLTARELIQSGQEDALADLFFRYGEIGNARKLASRIAAARKERPVETTAQLREIANSCAPRGKEFKYLAQVFQALRIAVNHETEVLAEFLEQATAALRPGGRLVVISYHSLEDRMVKNWFRTGNAEGELKKDFYGNVISPLKPLGRKAVTPSAEELETNNRARSARLRVAERTTA